MWKQITFDDIAATLSQAELDSYRRSASDGAGMPDPVEALLERTAEMVRGYIRANTAVRIAPAAGTIPVSLVSPTCDYAAYDILKRMPVKITDPRQRARDAASALFQNIAAGKFTPESWAEPGGEPANPKQTPVYSTEPPRLL